MSRRFDHHLVSPDAVHLIIDSLTLAVQISFNAKGREFVGDDTKGPSRGIGRGAIFSIGNNFRRGSILIAFTEGTKATHRFSLLWHEIGRPSTSLRGDDHPSSVDRIFSQFGHEGSSFWRRLRGETTFGLPAPLSLYSLLILSLGFAFDAKSGNRPGHESLFRNRFPTGFTNTKGSIINPIQGLLDLHDQFSFTVLDSQKEVSIRFQRGSIRRVGKVALAFLTHVVERLSCFLQQGMEPSLK
jgi:hypothetical protein